MEQDVHLTREDIIRFLRNGFLWALTSSLTVAAVIFFVRRDTPPTFETRAALYAGESAIDVRSIGLSFLVSPALHVSAYRLAAVSDSVLREALSSLGESDLSLADLVATRERLNVRTDPESRIVFVEASGRSGEEAAALANAVAGSLVAWDAQRPKDNLLQVIEGLQQRIAILDIQIATAGGADGASSSQTTSLMALRDEQVSQLSTAVMLSDSVIGRLEVVEVAAVPEAPVAPSPLFEAAVGGGVAFFLTYLGILILSILSPRARDLEEVARLSGVPILATYPQLPTPPRRLPTMPTSFLRAALTPVSGETKVILITGLEGDRTVSRLAIGLAESFALSGLSTLLIGATGSSGELQERYHLPPSTFSVTSSQARSSLSRNEVIRVQLDQEVALDVLPGLEQTPFTSERLANAFKNNLQEWKRENEILVIDTPSIFSNADALTLAKFADDVVVVLDRRTARRKEIVSAIDLMRRHGADITGTVITHVPTNRLGPKDLGASESTASKLRPLPSRS